MANDPERLRKYLKELVRQFEADPQSAWYVPSRVKCGNRNYDSLQFVERWLGHKGAPHMLLLGGYGGVKTYFCNRLAYQLARKSLQKKRPQFLPIVFSLSQLRLYPDLLRYVESRLQSLKLLDHPLSENKAWVRNFDNPACLMIFDELDEVRRELDPHQVRDLLDEISALPFPSARFFLSTRSHLFASSDQIKGVNKLGAWYQQSRDLSLKSVYLIAELEDFGTKQRKNYLRKRVRHGASHVEQLIQSIYGLEDLSARPLLLKMIVDSHAELANKKSSTVSLWDLYDVYTGNIFARRESQTGASEADLIAASNAIALHLFTTKETWIDFDSLRQMLAAKRLNLAHPENGISNLTSNLLLHREGDRFRFSHLSLYDFFLGNSVIDQIGKRKMRILANGALTHETLAFVFSAVRNRRRTLNWKWLVTCFEKRPSKGRSCWVTINLLSLFAGLKPQLLKHILPKALKSKDPEILKKALKITGYYDWKGGEKSISPLLDAREPEIRYLAIEAAGLKRISSAATSVIAAIDSSDENIRSVGLWSLSKIRDSETAKKAMKLLETEDKAALRAASEVLGKRQERSALPLLRSLLENDLDQWDRYYIEEAIDAITSRNKRSFTILASKIENDPKRWLDLLKRTKSEWLKRYIIDEIGEQRLVEYSAGLKALYDSEQPHIRHTIIDAIGEMRRASNSEFLINKFRAEKHPNIRANIIWALGNGTDPRALQIILQGLGDSSPLVRKWSQWAQTQYLRADSASNITLRYMYPR